MRRKKLIQSAALCAAIVCASSSCSLLKDDNDGEICLKFQEGDFVSTRASYDIPDTNDFRLTVSGSDGTVIYDGLYGAAPETIKVSPGSYTVKAVSCEFDKPQFDKPQFGDEKVVLVRSESSVCVSLECVQMNSGIRLVRSSDFLEAYPQGVLFVKSGNDKLMYAYTEKRIAYFSPGGISVVLNNEGKDEVLLTRSLESRDVLTLVLSVSASKQDTKGTLSICVDTTRNYLSENYVLGDTSSAKGKDSSNAMTIPLAKSNIGQTEVWVSGYIVGGDLSSSSTGISFQGPFSSATHIAVASKSSVTTKASCMSVQLPAGDVREALNLVANPQLKGRQVIVKGDIVSSYFGIPGIKNVTEYVIK